MLDNVRRYSLPLSIAFLTLLSGLFRFFKLDRLPLGLYHDEGVNGNDAVEALRTHHWQIFYPANNGREGLFINLQSLSIAIFGPTPFALRAVSALMGVLCVLGLYMLVRDLYDQRTAFIAGVLHSVLIWPVIVSRYGLRIQIGTAILMWMLWAMFRAYELTRSGEYHSWWAILAGSLLGLGFHTYISFRIVPLLVIAIGCIALLSRKQYVMRRTILICVGALVIASPLLLYFALHPQAFSGRAASVSVFAMPHPILRLGWNVLKEIVMIVHGDNNWRHNFGGASMPSRVVIPFFLIGILVIIRSLSHAWRARSGSAGRFRSLLVSEWKTAFLILWLVIGSLPGILSVTHEFPHGLRLLLISPALSLISALGIVKFIDWVDERAPSRNLHKYALPLILVIVSGVEFYRYFWLYAQSHAMHAYFLYPQYELAQRLEHSTSSRKRVIVCDSTSPVDLGIPIQAHGLAFLTQTVSPREQLTKNIYYARRGDASLADPNIEVIPLPPE